ncbi:MAG: glycosyltransferase family 2 protein [Actinobacteria bacterium]|nr:glycosyltransferase family 2 protein [Actinomycetota bacterium]
MNTSHDREHERVAVIIVTYKRPENLSLTLDSVLQQAVPPAVVVVVNNGPDSLDVAHIVRRNGVDLRILELQENRGYAGGLAAGIQSLGVASDHDYFWFLDDDSPVEPESLARAIQTLRALPPRSSLANRGHKLGWKRLTPVSASARPELADLVLVDGALVPQFAIESVGVPRADLFMMFEDFEISTRLRKHGFPLYVSNAVRSQPAHLGSTPEHEAWRGYYQTRNHLRVAIDLRDLRLLVFAFVRLGKQTGWQLVNGGTGRKEKITMRYRGLGDALRGRMGKTVEPVSSHVVEEIN